ncbi:MAG: glycosyltransferase family 9 protein [Candidatus Dormibacteria bacterium]
MNTAVVVPGGLAESLRAAPLIAAIGAGGGPPVVVCAPEGVELVRSLSGAGEVVPLAGLAAGRAGVVALWTALRSRRLDTALVCSERAWVRAAVFAAAIPRRLGCRAGLSDILLSTAVTCPREENRQRAWLRLASALGATSMPPGATLTPRGDALVQAESRLLATGVGDGRLLVAMAPGRGYGASPEQWMTERYAHLANRLASRHGAGIVLLGEAGDRQVVEALRVDLAAEVVDLCGELDLATAAAVISRCDLLVATDGPLLQVAAATGTPSVGLFAGSDGRRRGAVGTEHRVVQATANGAAASLDRIRVDDVLAAIEGSMEGAP